MFRNLVTKFKEKRASWSHDDEKDKKIKQLKEWAAKTGVTWHDIEDILFWKDPRLSLAIFIVTTGLFWKFITTTFQKIGLLIIAAVVPCSFPETRSYVTENLQLQIDPSARTLGFDGDDVFDVLGELWWKGEGHYHYMYNLKHSDPVKFYLISASYVVLFFLVFNYVPVSCTVYALMTVLYFFPILAYLDVYNVLYVRSHMLSTRLFLHWTNSQTKRHRDVTRKPTTTTDEDEHVRQASDIENEEFIPLNVKECENVLRAGIDDNVEDHHDLDDDDDDDDDGLAEFDVCDDFDDMFDIGSSSSNDEDSFLPVSGSDLGGVGVGGKMPSLNQIDG